MHQITWFWPPKLKNLPTVGGGTSLPHPPPARSLRSLGLGRSAPSHFPYKLETIPPPTFEDLSTPLVIMNSNSCPFSMVIQKHSTCAMVCLMLDVRCRQFHGKSWRWILYLTEYQEYFTCCLTYNKIILYPVRNYDWCKRIVQEKLSVSLN